MISERQKMDSNRERGNGNLSCSRTRIDTPPKSNIDTKTDGLQLHLLSNMAILGIHVDFRGCIVYLYNVILIISVYKM